MQIKTLTFHNAINYGAVLQAYALPAKIKELGYEDVYLYDYRNTKIDNSYKIFKKGVGLKGMIMQVAVMPLKIIKYRKFKRFIKKYIPTSNKVNDDDLFIVGSDQVWNYRASDFDKTFFLDFVRNKENKNSYASSFGFSKIPDEYRLEYKELLSEFKNISVREKTGNKIINGLLGHDVTEVVDPVLLIDKEKWGKIAGTRKDKYILMYLMAKTDSIMEFAKKLSEQTGLKVYYINDYAFSNNKNIVVKRCVGPIEWLNLFYNAEYVVTNSFHGTAFSICFNKNFFVELLPDGFDVNSRLTDVLDTYGLSDRIINNSECSTKNIDYNKVNSLVKREKQRSIDYLSDILD